MDIELLSRLQFAGTVMFHYLFPPLTIGLGVVLVYLEGMYLWKKDPLYETAAKFWTRIFGSPEAPMAWTLNSVVGTVVAATVAAVFAGPQPEGEGH